MELLLILLIIAVVAVLALGWLAVCVVATVVRLFARVLAAPFRAAKRADTAMFNQLTHSRPPRQQHGDDIRCQNRACGARLPIEAKFCARCGGALSKRAARPALVVDTRQRVTQVA